LFIANTSNDANRKGGSACSNLASGLLRYAEISEECEVTTDSDDEK